MDNPLRHGLIWTRPVLAIAVAAAAVMMSMADASANAYPGAPVDYTVPECQDSVTAATVFIDGGTVTNSTTLDLSADGGTAIGDASGGDDNLAVTAGRNRQDDRDGNRNRRDRRGDRAELASAGSGGVADAGAAGGAIAAGNVNSGGNVGSAIAVGDTWGGAYGHCGGAVGGVFIDGGEVINETIITVSADGGTAIADASGGDGNIAATGGRAGSGGTITSSAGSGGVATASADGGAISIGDINSGGNAGNAIAVGDTVVAPGPVCCPPLPEKRVPGIVPVKPIPAPAPGKAPGKVIVVELPSTGLGSIAGAGGAASAALMALLAGAASVAGRVTARHR